MRNMYSYFNDKTLGVGPRFAFTLCLQYLRTTQTWKLIRLSKFKPRRAPEVLEEPTQSVEDIHAVNRAKIGTKEIGLVLQDSNSPSRSTSQNNAVELDLKDSNMKRPAGVRKSQTAREMAKRNAAIAHGSDRIHALAEPSRKRNKIAEELVKTERQSALMNLFSMEGTDPSLRERFLKAAQKKALSEIELQDQVEGDTTSLSMHVNVPKSPRSSPDSKVL